MGEENFKDMVCVHLTVSNEDAAVVDANQGFKDFLALQPIKQCMGLKGAEETATGGEKWMADRIPGTKMLTCIDKADGKATCSGAYKMLALSVASLAAYVAYFWERKQDEIFKFIYITIG